MSAALSQYSSSGGDFVGMLGVWRKRATLLDGQMFAKRLILNVLLYTNKKDVTADWAQEYSEVLTVEITVGQWRVSFWYRQLRDVGNIAGTGRGLYSFLKSKLCLERDIWRNSFHRSEGVEALVFLFR